MAITELHSMEEENRFLQEHSSVVIFFGSRLCGHCQQMQPVYAKLANEFPAVSFAHVETTEVKVEGIEGVPTFAGYRRGTYIGKIVGADQEGVRELIKEVQ